MSNPPIRFGTDGVRGPAGTWPLTPEGAERIGCALGVWAGVDREVIIGMDTRASGPALAEALATGVVRGGANALLAGVLPTAGVSTAVLETGAAAGAMVTASHNPWTDNGIKIVGASGRKLDDIKGMEALFGRAPTSAPGSTAALDDPCGSWLRALPDVDLSGLRVLLDCAHGAAHALGPDVLESRGAQVSRLGCAPDGRNINQGVGALHPPDREQVRRAGCHLAICLDGDADRVLLVDPERGLLDGDDFLWILGRASKAPVVGTIMSNGGLEAALGERLLRSSVGDRHVADLMEESGAGIGAEPSGHVLFSDGMPTGDGLYAALRLLAAMPRQADGSPDLAAACVGWSRWEQARKNIRFGSERIDLESLGQVEIARESGARVVIRYSGTEPLLRIMVEGTGTGSASPGAWVQRISEEFLSR